MSLTTRRPLTLRRLAAAVVLAAGFGAALAGPAAAKDYQYRDHPIYNDRQAWAKVDRNQDGNVSSKEWKWAEKNGYDRLNGVPKKHLTRAEYQRYLTAYIDHSNAWRSAWYDNRQRQNWNNSKYSNPRRADDRQTPWYAAPGQKPTHWDYRGGHRAN